MSDLEPTNGPSNKDPLESLPEESRLKGYGIGAIVTVALATIAAITKMVKGDSNSQK